MSGRVGAEPAVPVERSPAVGGKVDRGPPSPIPLFSAYPAHRPFLNWHPISPRCPPTSAFPESNGTAVCTALLNLQRKLQQLESERHDARKQVSLLASRLRAYRLALAQRYAGKETEAASPVITQIPQNSSSQPHAALLSNCSPSGARASVEDRGEQIIFKTGKEHRMREIEREGPKPEWGPGEQGGSTPHDEHSTCKGGLVHFGKKLERLEKEYLRLSATQCLTQLQSGIERNTMLIHHLSPPSHETLRRPSQNCVEEDAMGSGKDAAGPGQGEITFTKSCQMESNVSKRKVGNHEGDLHRGECPFENQNGEQPKETRHPGLVGKRRRNKSAVKDRDPRYHYRLNLKRLPFVVGTSSSPSQALPGRLHSLLHSLKQHQPRLCCRDNDPSTQRSFQQQFPALHPGSESPPLPSTENLEDLLLALQDEFDHMTLEQQQLKSRVECASPQRRDELNAELAAITTRLENKIAQLTALGRFTELRKMHRETRGRGSVLRKEGGRSGGGAESRDSGNPKEGKMERGEAETVKKGKIVKRGRDIPGSRKVIAAHGTSSLQLFRDVKLLQASLAPADVGWS
uniref:Cep57 centrosome microtubule-binding domain-containing protein n=1 Tax=Eptatretus burgeri TaxID=7764 RepID=A0A8C4Q010_EPTBU